MHVLNDEGWDYLHKMITDGVYRGTVHPTGSKAMGLQGGRDRDFVAERRVVGNIMDDLANARCFVEHTPDAPGRRSSLKSERFRHMNMADDHPAVVDLIVVDNESELVAWELATAAMARMRTQNAGSFNAVMEDKAERVSLFEHLVVLFTNAALRNLTLVHKQRSPSRPAYVPQIPQA